MDAFEKVRAIGRAVLEFPERMKVTHPACIEAERLLVLGKFAEAESYFQNAAAELKAGAAPPRHLARVLLRVAHAQWKQKKTGEAQATVESAHALLTVKPKPSSDLSACLDLLGSLQESEGDMEGARECFRKALEVQKKIFPIQPVLLTQRYRRLAQALAKFTHSEAQALYKRAVEIAEQRIGTCAPVTADCLLDLGRFELLFGEKDAGIAAIERAIDINKETSGEISEEVALALQFAASSFQESNDLERAIAYYELALKVRERQLGGKAADFANLLMGFAETHTLLGNDAPAMELLQQAVGKLANVGGERYAAALESLGEAYWGLGHFPDAVSCLKKARAIWENDPKANEDVLEANSALLEQATQHVPSEAGSAGPLFKPGLRLREQAGRQKIAADAFVPKTQPQDTLFFGFSQSTHGLTPRVGWTPASMSSNGAETTSQHRPPAEQMAMPVNLAKPASTPQVVFNPSSVSPPLSSNGAETTSQHRPPAEQMAMPVNLAKPASARQVVSNPSSVSPPVPEAVAGSRLLVSFVNPDGSPITSEPPASPQEPVQMTIIVPEQGLPQKALLVPTSAPEHELKLPELRGWEELSFEFLSTL
jgi:tetratricopeptide (TPR) repeat protein